MKKYLALSIIVSLFAAGNVMAKQVSKSQVKSKSAQAKVSRHHEKNWHQPSYGRNIKLFRCHDSWGHKIRGKFTADQRYFIELGGGSCRKIGRPNIDMSVLSDFRRYDVHFDDVLSAIKQVKREFGLRHARLVEAENISTGRKSLKYTLVFKVGRNDYREFRVKQNRWNGYIRAVYEV